ncbi:MAG: TonB-dependent receptor, partial [Flavobacterium sp.]
TNIDPAQLLKQIPATSIKKIELITNPSAKYNPEGMSGIINIVLHKNSNDGFNGSFNSGITFGEVPKFNNSLDMNYRTGKVNFFTTLGSNFGERFNNGRVSRFGSIESKQFVDVVNDNESALGKLGMDYYINDKNTLSIYTNQNYSKGDAVIGANTIYAPGSASEDIFFQSNLDGDGYNNSYNLAFKHLFDKEGATLDFEANFNDSKDTQNVLYNSSIGDVPAQSYTDNLVDKRQNATANLDYVNPLNEKTSFEAGAEARIIRSDNDYNSTNQLITNPLLRNSVYSYDMDIYSAYVTFGQKLGKFSYQLGARFESYKVKANFNEGDITFDDDYITLYPSAYLTYSLNEKNMFQMSYSRRVDRPSLDQTKPVREFSTPLFTALGNPELEPQFTNSIELNYTNMFGKGSSVTAGVFYRIINNEINRVLYPDETTDNTQDQIMSYDNFDNNTAYGFEVSANYKINKWLDIQPAIDFSGISQQGLVSRLAPGSDTDYEFVSRKIDANAFNARLNSNFKVTQNFTLNLFGFYRGPVNGIQNNSWEMYKIDSGARYTLLDNNLTLSLRFNDMFNTMRYAFDSSTPFRQRGEFTWESRTVYFGLNYRFGGGKNKALQRKQRDNNTKESQGGMF